MKPSLESTFENAQNVSELQAAKVDSKEKMDCHATASAAARNDSTQNAYTSISTACNGGEKVDFSVKVDFQSAYNGDENSLCEKVDSTNTQEILKVDSRNAQNLHKQADSTFLSSRDFRKEVVAIHKGVKADSRSDSASAEFVDSKETSATPKRYPLFSKETSRCSFSKETSLRLFSKETCFGFALHRCRLFSKETAFCDDKQPNDSKNCGGALRALGQFGGGSYLSGNDCPQTAPIASNCLPKAELIAPKFHIFFNSSTPYLKYLSVLLHSIVAHANAADSTPFSFHILLDSRGFDEYSPQELAKLPALESLLNSVHSCAIITHDCAALLDTLPVEVNPSRVIYSRLFLARFVDLRVEKCLYLDVDMLALGDIREIFANDLQDSIIAVARDVVSTQAPLPAKDRSKAPYVFGKKHCYFNSGMMLVNLPKWRACKIEQQALAFLQAYSPICFDQDVLNAIISDQITLLDMCWNFQMQFYNQYRFYEYRIAQGLSRTNPLAQSFHNRKLIHYVCEPKPWDSPYLALDSTHLPMFGYERAIWWDLARKTKPFAKELIELESSFASTALEDYAHALSKDLQAMQLRVDKIIALLKNPLGFVYRACKARFTQ